MLRSRLIKGIAAAIVLVAIASAAHATLSLRVDPGLAFRGQFTWNASTSSVVKVRVQEIAGNYTKLVVEVKARAEDGSTVGGNQRLALPPGGGREVSINLPKRITSLQFTQIRVSP